MDISIRDIQILIRKTKMKDKIMLSRCVKFKYASREMSFELYIFFDNHILVFENK